MGRAAVNGQTAVIDECSPAQFRLPALRPFTGGAQPVLLYDTREVQPLRFKHLRCLRRTLSEGDYQISGISDFSIERKGSLDEVAACCIGENRERFEREMRRLIPYRFKRLLIVGASCDDDVLGYPYRSISTSVGSMYSIIAYRCAVPLPSSSDSIEAANS
jgi:ERCC4-type nuclease